MSRIAAALPGAALAAALAVATCAHAAAGETGAPPLEELIGEVLARSPEVAALAARGAGAAERVRPAGALPEPMVEGMLQDAGFPSYTVGKEEMSMLGIEISQGLLFPGKRGARRAVAGAAAEVLVADLERLQRTLAVEVSRLYAEIYLLDRERESLVAGRDLLALLAGTAASRYGAGQAELEAVAKAQLAGSRLEERLEDVRAERRSRLAALNRLRDRPGDEPLGEVSALPRLEAAEGPWQDRAVALSAEVAVARGALAAGERLLEVERLELRPNLSAGLGYAARGALDPVVTLSLGVELPLWRSERQRPRIRAAQWEVRGAEQDLRAAEARARSEAERIAAEWQRAESQVRRFTEAILPQASVALDAARSSYEAGRGDFSTVIEDFNLWLEARTGLARREADRLIAWAELQGLTAPAAGRGRKGATP